jgi:hypothetical protein
MLGVRRLSDTARQAKHGQLVRADKQGPAKKGLGVDKNTTMVFPAPLMSTIQELGAFLSREQAASTSPAPTTITTPPAEATIRPASSGSAALGRPGTETARTDSNGAPVGRAG